MVKKFHAFCKPWIFSSCAIYSQSKYEALRTTSFSLWNISKLASILHVAYLGCASDLIKGIEKWDELLPRYGLCITFSCFVRFLHILNWKGYYKWMKLHNYFHIYNNFTGLLCNVGLWKYHIFTNLESDLWHVMKLLPSLSNLFARVVKKWL